MTLQRIFPEYYEPTGKALEDLWHDAIIVLDTSVLLDFYEYAPSAREQAFASLRAIQERLWMPYQVALEYQRNRITIILREYKKSENMTASFTKILDNLASTTHKKIHVESTALMEALETTRQLITQELQLLKPITERDLGADPIEEALTTIFDGRVGPAYDHNRLEAIYKEGKSRYAKRNAPGFMDAEGKDMKPEPNRYGDFVVWHQVLDKAKDDARPILLVTNDTKEDWWIRYDDKPIFPQPYLRSEMRSFSGQEIWLYTWTDFLKPLEIHLGVSVAPPVHEEAKRIEDQQDSYLSNLSQSEFLEQVNSLAKALEDRRLEHQLALSYSERPLQRSGNPSLADQGNAIMQRMKALEHACEVYYQHIAPRIESITDEMSKRDLPAKQSIVEAGERLRMVVGARGDIASAYRDYIDTLRSGVTDIGG